MYIDQCLKLQIHLFFEAIVMYIILLFLVAFFYGQQIDYGQEGLQISYMKYFHYQQFCNNHNKILMTRGVQRKL